MVEWAYTPGYSLSPPSSGSTMRLIVPVNQGEGGLYAPHCACQPWENERSMRLMVPVKHGRMA